jgi:hypothetical protein
VSLTPSPVIVPKRAHTSTIYHGEDRREEATFWRPQDEREGRVNRMHDNDRQSTLSSKIDQPDPWERIRPISEHNALHSGPLDDSTFKDLVTDGISRAQASRYMPTHSPGYHSHQDPDIFGEFPISTSDFGDIRASQNLLLKLPMAADLSGNYLDPRATLTGETVHSTSRDMSSWSSESHWDLPPPGFSASSSDDTGSQFNFLHSVSGHFLLVSPLIDFE